MPLEIAAVLASCRNPANMSRRISGSGGRRRRLSDEPRRNGRLLLAPWAISGRPVYFGVFGATWRCVVGSCVRASVVWRRGQDECARVPTVRSVRDPVNLARTLVAPCTWLLVLCGAVDATARRRPERASRRRTDSHGRGRRSERRGRTGWLACGQTNRVQAPPLAGRCAWLCSPVRTYLSLLRRCVSGSASWFRPV